MPYNIDEKHFDSSRSHCGPTAAVNRRYPSILMCNAGKSDDLS